MIFNNYDPRSFKTTSKIDFKDVLSDATKVMTYYDGSTDFVDFNTRQTRAGNVSVVQLTSGGEYNGLFQYLTDNVGNEISITLEPGEKVFGANIDGTLNATLVEAVPTGEQSFNENGNFAIDLKLSYIDNPTSLPEYDFLIECEISAWSVDEIVPTITSTPTGKPVGYTIFIADATILPLAVHMGGEVWQPIFSKKRYEVTHYNDTRTGEPTFDGVTIGNDAYSGGDRTYWVWNGTQWAITPFPAIDPFKPVILNTDIPGLKNSKFYWSSFSDLPIDNSDPTDLLPANYESGVIQKKGIKFPTWLVSLENGSGVEKISGFSFELQNADRKNILSNQINFFGSWCTLKVWDKSQNQAVTIRSGVNRTSGFSLASFQFDVEPKTWLDNPKTIPNRSMAGLLENGENGTKRSEDLIPQTYGSWDWARTRVKVQNVGVIEVDNNTSFIVVRDPIFDAVNQTIDIFISINTSQWNPSTTQYIKALGEDRAFQILGWLFYDDEPDAYPDGYALIRIKAGQTYIGLFDVAKSVSLVENKFQLIIDDKPCQGFGTNLDVFTYDQDSNKYNPVPTGTFVVIDNQTIALGGDPTSFLINDDFTLYSGKPVFVSNNQYNHSSQWASDGQIADGNNGFLGISEGLNDNGLGVEYQYGGTLIATGQRAFFTFNGDKYYNLPSGTIGMAKDVTITNDQGFPQPSALWIVCRYLPNVNTHLWLNMDTNSAQLVLGGKSVSSGRDNMYPIDGNPNTPTNIQNQPGRADGFYYHQLNGGRVSAYDMRRTEQSTIPGFPISYSLSRTWTLSDDNVIMTQRFPITPEVKNTLRGATSVRLLGSLWFSYGVGKYKYVTRPIPGIDRNDFGFVNEMKFMGFRMVARITKTGDPSADQIVLDKTFNVDDDTTAFDRWGGYRQSSVWGSPGAKHCVYNLPDSMGGNTEKYYGEDDTTESKYVRLIIERSRDYATDPTLGGTMVAVDRPGVSGTIVGFQGTIWDNVMDWVEVLVEMDGNDEFQVGEPVAQSGWLIPPTQFLGVLKYAPTKDRWHTGRDLLKLDDILVDDLFNQENFKFGDFDNLDVQFIPFHSTGSVSGNLHSAEIGFGNPYDHNVTEHQGIFWESASELDLSDAENVFVKSQGRLNNDGELMQNPDEIFEHQLKQIDKDGELTLDQSIQHEGWKTRDQLFEEHSLQSLLDEYTRHIFGVVVYGDSGDYVAKSLDYLDHPIQPGDFKANFNPSNIIKGSIKEIKYRDVDSIHTEFEFNFNFSPGKKDNDRKMTLRWNDSTNELEIGGFGGDNDPQTLVDLKQSLLDSLSAELSEQFRVSRNFYNTGTTTKKIIDLPLCYDSHVWVTDNKYAISTLTNVVSKWVRFFLFNSWTIKFQTKMDVVISQGVRLGDLVTFQFDSITDDQKLFGFIRSIKPAFYDGHVEIEMFASVDPWVYSKFYDRVWDAGIVSDSYDANQFKHTEFFVYPFKDTNQNGTFSDNGNLNDPGYDPNNFEFTDDSVADPEEPFTPLP